MTTGYIAGILGSGSSSSRTPVVVSGSPFADYAALEVWSQANPSELLNNASSYATAELSDGTNYQWSAVSGVYSANGWVRLGGLNNAEQNAVDSIVSATGNEILVSGSGVSSGTLVSKGLSITNTNVDTNGRSITVSVGSLHLGGAQKVSAAGHQLAITDESTNISTHPVVQTFGDGNTAIIRVRATQAPIVLGGNLDVSINPTWTNAPATSDQTVKQVSFWFYGAVTNFTVEVDINGVPFFRENLGSFASGVHPVVLNPPVDVNLGDVATFKVSSPDGDVSLRADINNVPYQEVVIATWVDMKCLSAADVFTPSDYIYTDFSFEIGSSGFIRPVKIGGDSNAHSWSTSGTVPSELSVSSVTGNITYNAVGSTASSGTFLIQPQTDAGPSEQITFNYNIDAGLGVARYCNTENIYPALRVYKSSYPATNLFRKMEFNGKTTGLSDGTIIADSSRLIYYYYRGDGKFDYLIYPEGFAYYVLYVGSAIEPSQIAAGLSTDLTINTLQSHYIGWGTWVVNGVNILYDQVAMTYLSTTKYFDAGVSSTFNGFMSSDNSWSFGFQVHDNWLRDGLGRALFCKFPRNWLSANLSEHANISSFVYGNGSGKGFVPISVYPWGGFGSTTRVTVTYDHTTTLLQFIISDALGNSTFIIWSGNASTFLDPAASIDSLPLRFGITPESDSLQPEYKYYHGFFQGEIRDLWVSVGSAITGYAGIPAGATHSWLMNETTGSTFTASTGGIDMVGRVL